MLQWICFFLAVLLAFSTTGKSDLLSQNPPDYLIQQKPQTPHLTRNRKLEKIFDNVADCEKKHLDRSFKNLDRLFYQMNIRFKMDNGDDYYYSNLGYFLESPHDKDAVFDILNAEVLQGLSSSLWSRLESDPQLSLFSALKLLWHKKVITAEKAHLILQKYVRASPDEIIRLFENGIVKTEKGYLIELRTGHTWGDALKLDDIVFSALNALSTKDNINTLSIESADCLTNEGLRRELLERLREDHHHADNDLAHAALTDAHLINLIRSHFMSYAVNPTATWFRPPNGNAATVVNTVNSSAFTWNPSFLSVMVVGNHYFANINASMANSMTVDPVGIFYSGAINLANGGPSWWVRFSDGYLGVGANYTVNFANGSFWSQSQPTFASFGANIAGFRDFLSFGINLQTLFAHATYAGANAQVTINRSHDVTYLGTYPIDGKIKEIRGLHKIEINDLKGASLSGSAVVNFSPLYVPVTFAFKAMATLTKKRLYRTHRELPVAQAMMHEAGHAGILYLLGRKIKTSKLPHFENPEDFQVGDELVEVKIGKLWGGFLVGLESQIPIHAARVAASGELIAEFEVALKRWPNNKYEVSVEPIKIMEGTLFESILNTVGGGENLTAAFAKKQVYMFDFNNPHARDAYFQLVEHGRLPNNMDIKTYARDRGAEYLLSHFRAQNEILAEMGVQRTLLEKVTIDGAKAFGGINPPIIPAFVFLINEVDKHTRKSKKRLNLKFEGLDIGMIQTDSESIVTNGLISAVMHTYGGRTSFGQGFSGRKNEDIWVTHKRVHTIDQNGQNKWQFDSLVLNARISDSVITGDEENLIRERVNHLFSTHIERFYIRGSKQQRIVDLQRAITKKDILVLTSEKAWERVGLAAQHSNLDPEDIEWLLKNLPGNHPDEQGLLLKAFVEKYNLLGFSALHHLLGGRIEDLILRSSAGYDDVIASARMFIMAYSNKKKGQKKLVSFTSEDDSKNRKVVKNFYRDARNNLRAIDTALRLLYDDKYFVDERSNLYQIFSEEKVSELIKSGVRQPKKTLQSSLISSRNTILKMMNLKRQKCEGYKRRAIYDYAQSKNLRFFEKTDHYELSWHNLIEKSMSKKDIRDRMDTSANMIKKINLRLKLNKKDKVMNAMDPDYMKKERQKLRSMRRFFIRMSSLDHLSEKDRNKIRKKFINHVIFNFPGHLKSNHRIRSAIDRAAHEVHEDTLFEEETHREHQGQPFDHLERAQSMGHDAMNSLDGEARRPHSMPHGARIVRFNEN